MEIYDLELDLLKVKGEIVESSFMAGSGIKMEPDSIAFEAEMEPYSFYWSVEGGTYIRLVDGASYFVVRRRLVARLDSDGVFHIKGHVIVDQTLPAATASPLSYDSDRHAIAFAISDLTRVMEIDRDGNILLPQDNMTDQTLAFSGQDTEIGADANAVWMNIGGTRKAEISSDGVLQTLQDVNQTCEWGRLYADS